MKKLITFLSCAVLLFASCSKDSEYKEEIETPLVEWQDNDSGIFITKIGREVLLKPIVKNVAHPEFAWFIGEKEVSTAPTYTFVSQEEGQYYILLKVSNQDAVKTVNVRIDVSLLAPPQIALAVPQEGLSVQINEEVEFKPVFRNDGEEDSFSCSWFLDDQKVEEGRTYRFSQSAKGAYSLRIEAKNTDGITKLNVPIKVVDQLTASVEFPALSYEQSSTTRSAVSGRKVYVQPRLHNFKNPIFQWKINGELVAVKDKSAALFSFTPDNKGADKVEYKIEVEVSEAPATKALTRNIASVGVKASAQMVVNSYAQAKARPQTSNAYASKVYEYVAAPGQFINEWTEKDPLVYATNRLKEKEYVSLGSFGGYIVVGFDHSVPVAGSEYDFAVLGNSFKTSSEPGVVYVMQDVNGNGLPDDEWYELKGSEWDKPETKHNYSITYYRPQGIRQDVAWKDAEGKTGIVRYVGNLHMQDYYYPSWIKENSYTLYGTSIKPNNQKNPETGFWENNPYPWGYADNYGEDILKDVSVDEKTWNGFKVSNAIHPDGTPVQLDFIDFVKIQSGVMGTSDVLGEISTEVLSIKDMSIK